MQTATLPHVKPVPVSPVSPGLFRQVLDASRYRELSASIVHARELLAGRVVWNVNSTARGGAVAEMLQSVIAYLSGAGIDTRWVVIQGGPEFFKVTKRVHNQIQGFEGDGGELGEREHEDYVRGLAPAALELATIVRPGDIVLLHDPQTAGLVPELKDRNVTIVWRCHVGVDTPNERAENAWRFLMRYLPGADSYVFSRATYVWKDVPRERIAIIPPSIDPFSPKNNMMTRARAAAILISSGLVSGFAAATPYYVRPSGTMGLVSRRAEVIQLGPPIPATRLVAQVSRWDRLKDPIGVMEGFANYVPTSVAAHLVLAGPEVTAVADDPEGAEVLHKTIVAWEGLPELARRRIHLACLPMQDLDENAAIVNALQRWSEVIVQKSLAEGFGLTVSEAMWKARPVVASRIGGIQDQIDHERSGILLDDPTDLQAYAGAVTHLLSEPSVARQMGDAAMRRAYDQFLTDRHLKQYLELFSRLLS
jgi:trehalose synthase